MFYIDTDRRFKILASFVAIAVQANFQHAIAVSSGILQLAAWPNTLKPSRYYNLGFSRPITERYRYITARILEYPI
jgi:hypothetical protein